jgi:hypothetical protein
MVYNGKNLPSLAERQQHERGPRTACGVKVHGVHMRSLRSAQMYSQKSPVDLHVPLDPCPGKTEAFFLIARGRQEPRTLAATSRGPCSAVDNLWPAPRILNQA